MNVLPYVIMSVLAILFGQITKHLNKKMPPVVSEEISYKEFFASLKSDFKFDIKYTLIYLALFNALVYFVGNVYSIYLYAVIIFALMLVFSIDFRYQLIPDECHIIIGVCGIINIFFNLSSWWTYLVGAVIGGLIFYLLGLLALLIFKKEGMGFGDVKLMAALGLFFGMKSILVIALVSFIFGAIIGGILLIAKKKDGGSYIPFGPFIVIGAIILMFVPSDAIIDIYINFCTWLGNVMFSWIYSLNSK